MTHRFPTEFTHLLRSLAASFLVAGVLLGGTGAAASIGTPFVARDTDVQMIPSIANGKITMVHAVRRTIAHAAAPEKAFRHIDANMQIALGMLLLLTGCLLHCAWVVCHASSHRRHRKSR